MITHLRASAVRSPQPARTLLSSAHLHLTSTTAFSCLPSAVPSRPVRRPSDPPLHARRPTHEDHHLPTRIPQTTPTRAAVTMTTHGRKRAPHMEKVRRCSADGEGAGELTRVILQRQATSSTLPAVRSSSAPAAGVTTTRGSASLGTVVQTIQSTVGCLLRSDLHARLGANLRTDRSPRVALRRSRVGQQTLLQLSRRQ